LQLAVAIVLLLLVATLISWPDIRLTNARFDASSCAGSGFVVTAFVTLLNSGALDGDVYVRFYVDEQRRASREVFVSAMTSVQRALSVEITDCSLHRYSVDTCLPSGKRMTC
jgi:hypothetical protein